MGLLNKIFRSESRTGDTDSAPLSATRFQVTEDEDEQAEARQAVRRELVQVTLRETMRRHAVPSDWMEVRMLPVVTSKGRNGMHVQLVVRQGQGSLLAYVPSFQSSFMAEIEKFEPRAWDWLFSISWQFAGITSTSSGDEPAPGAWQVATAPSPPSAEEVPGVKLDPEDDDVAQDLKALFAIRDAALRPGPHDGPDFENTRPSGGTEGGPGR